jgi:anti-sigma factor RsiW
MTNPSFHDMEQLSAFLDGELSQTEMARVETRLPTDRALAALLVDLRQARELLHRTPKRKTPRNFTLTPRMAGIRPPVPRLVPALSWASAAATLMFFITLGTNLIGRLSLGATAPMLAAAPMSNEGYGFGGGPAATQPSGSDNSQMTTTPENSVLAVPDTSPAAGAKQVTPLAAAPGTNNGLLPSNIWPYIWLGLALALVATALLVRLVNVQAFHRRLGGKKNLKT